MARTALLAGATGLVGSALLPRLLDSPDYERVIVLARRQVPQRHAKLEVVETALDDLDPLGAKLAVDDVFCCLGTTTEKVGGQAGLERVDYHMVVDLARSTQAAGAKQFLVVSAAGASLRSPVFYSRVKARMEQTVARAGFATIHIVRPSLLLGKRADARPYEAIAQRAAPLLGLACVGPLRKYRPISAEMVATTLVTLATRPAVGVKIHELPLLPGGSAAV